MHKISPELCFVKSVSTVLPEEGPSGLKVHVQLSFVHLKIGQIICSWISTQETPTNLQVA